MMIKYLIKKFLPYLMRLNFKKGFRPTYSPGILEEFHIYIVLFGLKFTIKKQRKCDIISNPMPKNKILISCLGKENYSSMS